MADMYCCAVAKNIPNGKIYAPMLEDGAEVIVIPQAFGPKVYIFMVDNSVTPELVPLLFGRKITYEVAIGLDAATDMGLDLDGDIIRIVDKHKEV